MIAAAFRSGRDWPLGDRIMKVAHAGEHGAVQIYKGQILAARLRAPDLVALLRDFLEHERAHRAIFEQEPARRARPWCSSYWLCGIGGWCLGVTSGLLGRGAIAATTVAVERTVLHHLHGYHAALRDVDGPGAAAVSAIIADEQAHHDHFDPAPATLVSRALDRLVTATTEGVIALGMRL